MNAYIAFNFLTYKFTNLKYILKIEKTTHK